MDAKVTWTDMKKYYEKLVASGGKLKLISTTPPSSEEYKDPIDIFEEKYIKYKKW